MSRIASVGLAAVLIALTLVTLWAVSVSQGVATDTAAAGVTSGDLGQLQYFIAGEQSSERDFLNRRNGSAKAFYASAAHFSRELGSLQTTGSSSGLQLASVVQVLHQRYVDSFSRYLTAARARHVTRARKIQVDESRADIGCAVKRNERAGGTSPGGRREAGWICAIPRSM